jgi:hypothetical protein
VVEVSLTFFCYFLALFCLVLPAVEFYFHNRRYISNDSFVIADFFFFLILATTQKSLMISVII